MLAPSSWTIWLLYLCVLPRTALYWLQGLGCQGPVKPEPGVQHSLGTPATTEENLDMWKDGRDQEP